MFPYTHAKTVATNLLEKYLPKHLSNKAEVILNLHLDTRNFVMTKMTQKECMDIQEMIASSSKVDEINSKIIKEDIHTKKGIFKVLVRTHLNRSGMNHVSMGFWSKTQSPRILNFIDTLNLDVNYDVFINNLFDSWFDFACKNQNAHEVELCYDERAMHALKVLKTNKVEIINLFNNSKISAFFIHQKFNIDLGWCRIFLGTLSGFAYLFKRKWNLNSEIGTNQLSYLQIHSAIKDCQNSINEYGYALAGSFFADLGGAYFVKDDTHVRDCMTVVCPNLNTAESRVQQVINDAESCGFAPRVLDKVMYVPCSGNLYLIDHKISEAHKLKKEFIKGLQSYA